MKTHAFKLSALALATGIFLQGCTLDGDTGPQGEQGLQGPIGETGATGSAGADASTKIGLSLIARSVIEAEAAAEILQYHSATQTVYATYTGENKVAMLDLANVTSSELANPLTADTLSPETFDIEATVDGKTIDGMQSIAISGNMLAVAVQTDVKTDNGYVLFYNNLENGAPEFVKAVEVGALPDMVTFTPDGSKLLAANEGEPKNDYSIDPA